jgi:adenosine deaminase
MTDLAAFIRSLPKAELHVHLEGCVTPEQVVAIGQSNGVELFESVEAAGAAYEVSSLDDFLEIFREGVGGSAP